MSVAVLVLLVLTWTVGGGSHDARRGGAGGDGGPATDELGRTISVLEPLNASDSRQPPGLEGAEPQTRILWKTPARGTDRLRAFDEL
ncbi:hypothetical protein NLG97_g10126 [Lecanicillium saksenae]|uniref:Uncharacterized protein n=1 Tax=Lecanicillium saksenae TaxID=468837 RepID=A0ACC1QEK4_9HYPO|nr:hypothetical protein NLG97_g10126 [Lecanicillium saksenae]